MRQIDFNKKKKIGKEVYPTQTRMIKFIIYVRVEAQESPFHYYSSLLYVLIATPECVLLRSGIYLGTAKAVQTTHDLIDRGSFTDLCSRNCSQLAVEF